MFRLNKYDGLKAIWRFHIDLFMAMPDTPQHVCRGRRRTSFRCQFFPPTMWMPGAWARVVRLHAVSINGVTLLAPGSDLNAVCPLRTDVLNEGLLRDVVVPFRGGTWWEVTGSPERVRGRSQKCCYFSPVGSHWNRKHGHVSSATHIHWNCYSDSAAWGPC